MGIFRFDSPLMQFLTKLTDLIILNFLAVVCSIPIVTIGASASGLYYAVDRMYQEEGSAVKDFFSAFKSNFKQSTILWLIYLAAGVVLFFALFFYGNSDMQMRQVLFSLTALLILVWAFCFSWIFPLQTKFVNTIGAHIRNSMVCAIGFLPRTVLMTLINAVPVILFFCFPYGFIWCGFIWLAFWFALATMWNLKLLKKPFETLMGINQAKINMEEEEKSQNEE